MTKKQIIKYAFVRTLPILCSYLFLGLAYGIMMNEAGFAWYYTLLSSLFIYSGTCQFLLIPFCASSASLLTVALTVLLVSSRQSFYSLTFLKDFKAMGKRKLYMIHSLTDETYAVNTTLDGLCEKDRHGVMFCAAVLSHFYWVFSTVIGSLIGRLIPFELKGIDFCMTALFVIIFIDKWEKADKHSPALIGLGAGTACLLIFGQDNFMLPTLLTASALLLLINSADGKGKTGKGGKSVTEAPSDDSYKEAEGTEQ